ncbi:MAG: hypothetical protein QXN01_00600 [Candidatus Anstonellales archaeon]
MNKAYINKTQDKIPNQQEPLHKKPLTKYIQNSKCLIENETLSYIKNRGSPNYTRLDTLPYFKNNGFVRQTIQTPPILLHRYNYFDLSTTLFNNKAHRLWLIEYLKNFLSSASQDHTKKTGNLPGAPAFSFYGSSAYTSKPNKKFYVLQYVLYDSSVGKYLNSEKSNGYLVISTNSSTDKHALVAAEVLKLIATKILKIPLHVEFASPPHMEEELDSR